MSRRHTVAVLMAFDVDATVADQIPGIEGEAMNGVETVIWRRVSRDVALACQRLTNEFPGLDCRLPGDPEVITEYTYDTEEGEF